jgi:LysM repeat protein
MADDDAPGGGAGGGRGGEKKILGIPRTYLIVGGVALAGGLAWMWWERTHGKKTASSSTSTTVITGSVSSNTGISGSMLNAILKDWQQNPGSSSTSTGTATKKSTSTKTKTATTKTTAPPKTTKTTTPAKTNPTPVKKVTGYREVTVKAGQTLDEIAKQYGITPAELASQNVYVAGEVPGNKKVGQTLGTGAGLKTGQVLKVPVYS